MNPHAASAFFPSPFEERRPLSVLMVSGSGLLSRGVLVRGTG